MLKNIKDFHVKGKRILVRCDFNVPLDEKGNIIDDYRIKKGLPTIEYLIKNEAKIILMSHLSPTNFRLETKEENIQSASLKLVGDKHPENQGFVSPNFTLDGVAKKLSEYLSRTVKKTDDCIGEDVLQKVSTLEEGEILLLENLRLHRGEMDNSYEFAKKLSELGDIYINDAFSVCHRVHASIVGLPKILPSGIGLLLQKEIESLDKILKNPTRPMLALVGGIKAETKVNFIGKILKVADYVILSGHIRKEMMEKKLKFRKSKKIISPVDNLEALDVDEKTIKIFRQKILSAKTILWNGPFGKFEDENYKHGTMEIAKAIIKSWAFSVVGGGETIEFLDRENLIADFGHISTGGGAMLAYLSGEKLPGLEALENYANHS